MANNDPERTIPVVQSSEMLLLEEVAARCRTSISTVRHWISTGRLASTRPGRRRLVKRDDVDRLLLTIRKEVAR